MSEEALIGERKINAIKKDFVSICHMLHGRGLVAGLDGNVSVRLGDGTLLVTPSRRNKGFVTTDEILRTDETGAPVDGKGAVTSEIGLHAAVYSVRPDAGAVIHTHAPFCTAFAIAGKALPENLLLEIPGSTGRTAVAPFARPGTPGVAAGVAPLAASGFNGIILPNHGIAVIGKTLSDAYSLLEALENAAKSLVFARLIGEPVEIPEES